MGTCLFLGSAVEGIWSQWTTRPISISTAGGGWVLLAGVDGVGTSAAAPADPLRFRQVPTLLSSEVASGRHTGRGPGMWCLGRCDAVQKHAWHVVFSVVW